MPFPRPNLSTLRTQTAGDFAAELPGIDALLRYSNEGVTAEVLAGLVNGMYGYLDWIALQSTPFTATDEYLEGWAALKQVIRKPATAATGMVSFPATGGFIPAGTPLNRSDGFAYVTTADRYWYGGSISLPIAATNAGAAGNAEAGVAFSLGFGVGGVTPAGTASAAITGGADIESDALLRSRMLAAYAAPAQGGSITDYAEWTLQVPGVSRAWIKPAVDGPGTIGVLFTMQGEDGSQTTGFPIGTDGVSTYEVRGTTATGDQLAVADHLFGLQSVTPVIHAIAPIANELTLDIVGLATGPQSIRDAIAYALARAILADSQPGGVTNLSAIDAAIAAVPGSAGFIIQAISCSAGTVAPAPVGNITSNDGALATFHAVNWL